MQESTADTSGRPRAAEKEAPVTPWRHHRESPPFSATDELHLLLGELGRRGFLVHSFQADQHGPELVAAVCNFGTQADVFLLLDARQASAFRTPTGPEIDVFAPRTVFWWYMSSPIWTLRALLTLDPPGHPQAPHDLVEVPPELGLPVDGRRPVRVRRRTTGESS